MWVFMLSRMFQPVIIYLSHIELQIKARKLLSCKM
jgi:hypothetical protein